VASAAVALFVPAGPVVAQTPFSHQVHLGRAEMRCVDCHAAATASTAATDTLIPGQQKCRTCHDGDELPGVQTAFLDREIPGARTYRFDHQVHLGFGNIAPLLAAAIDNGSYLGNAGDLRAQLDAQGECEACHRGLRQVDLAGKTNLPRMADCLTCHSEIDNPFSCETCHLPGVNLRPASHTREFVDTHATGKPSLDKMTCLPCHGRNFACMGCH
jgi:hypothetical protein